MEIPDGNGESVDGDGSEDGGSDGGKPELTDNQKKQLENAINKQKKFMDATFLKKLFLKKIRLLWMLLSLPE